MPSTSIETDTGLKVGSGFRYYLIQSLGECYSVNMCVMLVDMTQHVSCDINEGHSLTYIMTSKQLYNGIIK